MEDASDPLGGHISKGRRGVGRQWEKARGVNVYV